MASRACAGPGGRQARPKKVKACPIGFLHMDVAEGRTSEGKPCLFVAVERASKLAAARLHKGATRPAACRFLEGLLKVGPCRAHTLLTDHGIRFAQQPRSRRAILSPISRFGMICEANEIKHRLTKPNHPWINGQVERTSRTIKDATAKRCHHEDHEQLRQHLGLFLDACNHARRLKTPKRLTPARLTCKERQVICKDRHAKPEPFHKEPSHSMAEPYS